MDELPLLIALRIKGLADAGRAAIAAGLTAEAASDRLNELAQRELVRERSGSHRGYTLTAAGTAHLTALLATEGLRDDPGLREGYERFMRSNRRVIELASSWQVRDGVPNDHTDLDYDEGVISRLVETHESAQVCVRKLAGCAPRYALYGERLQSCVDRLLDGDHRAITAPKDESYHTVWFELHKDLMLTLDVERED